MAKDTLPRSDFYVYVIFRPNGVPCYVGKGQKDRWLHHAKKCHNRHLASIYAQAGGSLPLVKVREGLSEFHALQTEVALISAIGRGSSGPLVNLTDGGDGVSGYDPPESHRAKTRAALIGRKRPDSIGEAVKRAWLDITPERRANMSAAQKGKVASLEQRLNQSLAHLARCGKTLEDVAAKQGKLTKFQRGILNRPVKTREELSEALRIRNAGNHYGIGNKRSAEGQVIVTQSVTESNRRRNKTGRLTIHKGPKPWMDEGMSRTSWYRKRANARDGGSEANS